MVGIGLSFWNVALKKGSLPYVPSGFALAVDNAGNFLVTRSGQFILVKV